MDLNTYKIFFSYPRLTLDFHTNKRIIDEVVRIYGFVRPFEILIEDMSGCGPFQASA